jgi:hypothetical protein
MRHANAQRDADKRGQKKSGELTIDRDANVKQQIRDRDSFSTAIAAYDDDSYVALMAKTGREHQTEIQAALS